MANKKPWEDEPNSRYRPDTLRLAGRNDAAYQTEKLANEVYDLGYDEGKAANQAAVDKAVANAAATQNMAAFADAQKRAAANLAVSLANNPASGAKTVSPLAKQKAAGTAAGAASPTVADVASTPKELLSEDYLRQLADRQEKGFSYDMNADYLYQLYKDQYMRQGKLAMQDTMGQAAALTGGYGNTYAERVGQSAYNQYLQQLNDRVPELYQLALNKYQMEGDEMKDMYSILANREAAANEEAWKQKEWDLTLQQFEFDKDKFGKEYALELAKQALDEKVANHDMSIQDAELILKQLSTQADIDKTYADIDLGYKNFDENKRQFDAELGYKYYDTDANLAYKYYDTNLDNAYNNAKLALERDDLNAHVNGTYYDTSKSGSSTTEKTLMSYFGDDQDAVNGVVRDIAGMMTNPAQWPTDRILNYLESNYGEDIGARLYILARTKLGMTN